MRRRGLVLCLTIAGVACGARPGPKREAKGPDGPWTWTTRAAGPWRLPARGLDVILLDDAHAVVRTGARELVLVDIKTGAVGTPVAVVPKPASIELLVSAGGRVLAFGADGTGPAAWAITAEPLTATTLSLPDPEPVKPTRPFAAVAAVSPDGSRVLVCGPQRYPIVRDAATLAAQRVFADLADCRDPHFTDADHVMFKGASPRLLDIRTGAVTALPPRGGTTVYPGPGGKSLAVADYARFQFTDAGGKPLAVGRGYGTPRWLPDGSAVITMSTGQLVVHPVGTADTRTIALPLKASFPRVEITTTGTAILVTGYTVLAVDLAAGSVRTASGNIGGIVRVAPRRGTVIVAADRLRAWREGRLVANGEAGVFDLVADPPDAPVLTMTAQTVSAWDPTTGDRRIVRELEEAGTMLGRAGDRMLFDDGYYIYRGRGGRPPTRWFRFREDLALAGVDVGTGRIAWTYDDGYHLADLVRGTVWSFAGPGCNPGVTFRFAPGKPRAAIDEGGVIHVYDTATKRALGGVELEALSIDAYAFVPATGELVLAAERELVLWDPASGKALAWKTDTTAPPVAVAVDAASAELALGYADGSVVWATLAGLRAHAKPRAVVRHPPTRLTCADAKVPHPSLDDLSVQGGDEPDPTDHRECDDDNDNPDDDCSEIYGTP